MKVSVIAKELLGIILAFALYWSAAVAVGLVLYHLFPPYFPAVANLHEAQTFSLWLGFLLGRTGRISPVILLGSLPHYMPSDVFVRKNKFVCATKKGEFSLLAAAFLLHGNFFCHSQNDTMDTLTYKKMSNIIHGIFKYIEENYTTPIHQQEN